MYIGIEIATDALRAVCLTRREATARSVPSGRKPLRTAEVPLDTLPNEPAAAADALAAPLAELLAQLRPGKASIAVAVPSAWCFYRVVSFPYRSASRLGGTLQYALDTRLPGAVETYVVEPLTGVMPAGAAGSRVNVAACPVERLKTLLAAFRKAHAEPAIVQPAVASVARRLRAVSPGSAGTALTLRLSPAQCEIALVRDGEVVACRVLRLGCLDPAVADDSDAIAQRIRFTMRTFEACEGMGGYHRVFLLGLICPALAETLERELGRAVETPPAQEGPFFAARGAAMEAAAGRRAAVNLRRGTYAYPRYARRTERRIAAALALLIGMGAMLGVKTGRDIAAARQDLESYRTKEATLFSQVVSAEGIPPTLEAMKATLVTAKREAKRTGPGGATSCLRRWVDLMNLLPEDSGIEFDVIDINQRRIDVTAKVPKASSDSEFRSRLENSRLFSLEDRSLRRKPGSKDRAYTLEMELRYK